jgi:hypothetical protein
MVMSILMKAVALRAVLMAAMLFAPGIALAQNAHFLKATGSLDTTTGGYTATWKEAGLGNSPVTYDLSSTASFTWQCFTKSGNQPQGAPNSTTPSTIFTTGTFPPSHNGTISGSLTLEPVEAGHCNGNGLKNCLTAVDYQQVVLQDITSAGTPSVGLPSASASGLELDCH